MTTIREHAELLVGANTVGFGSLRTWANFNREHAQAIIDALDAAAWQYDYQRLVPDPPATKAT